MLMLMLMLVLVAEVAGLRWVVVVLLVLVLVLVVAVRLRRGSCRGRGGRRGAFGGVVHAVKVPEKVAASRIGALAVAWRRRRQWWRLLRRRRLLRRSQGRVDIPLLVAVVAVGAIIGRCWLCLCL